jgi:hypothetical protein
MKTLTTLFALALFCATGHAQTIKSLGYNTVNGQVVYTGTNVLTFTNQVSVGDSQAIIGSGNGVLFFFDQDGTKDIFGFDGGEPDVARARANLGLGATNNVVFRNITSDGNVIITNQSAANNGLLFIYRTNNEPFLGLANLIASNNTTPNNETLFRVGVSEATNKAAQFGFRTTSTNGDGVAVFSVFGFNALAMIGPSARSLSNSLTNTNAGIEADIFSINPTNKVATLIDTNTGALTMHRPVGFNTNATAPANTNTPAGWLQFFVGTNSVRVPYYQ